MEALMNQPLRVLLIEDSEDDALLILRELRRGGYEPLWERHDTAAALDDALRRHTWDIILCDYVMPEFSGPAALQLLRERGVTVPVIIVSCEIGPEVAAAAVDAGACEYVMKDVLEGLVPAVQRGLQSTATRRPPPIAR